MDDLFTFTNSSNTKIDIHIDDCINILSTISDNHFDAIITDPPYELFYMGKKWDQTGIAFSPHLWNQLFRVLKPGGYIAAFGATRLYHKLANAAENVGFNLYPFMIWQFPGGLPKPINVSELFDRDNISEREIIGYKNGSGYTKANVDQGAQNRSSTQFPIYARHVSSESKDWQGYFYGVNTLKPCFEPIMIGQKPISEDRVIDNIRKWKTGALNIGALENQYGSWPTNTLCHKKAKKNDHQSNHPSVKPIPLMQDLCLLLCPTEGTILDPFAGTGTTGVAARNCNYNCVLIECNPEMEPIIKRRTGVNL
jgi:site-specific DNA-methyltransferase (adenine-specific)